MSWNVSSVGRPKAVAAVVRDHIAACKCTEPEGSIKNAIGQVIARALEAFPDTAAVSVSASGSQSGATNQLKVEIAPLWNFVE